ncbi:MULTISPECIES: CAP domain-containing protein [Streptomyces]|uniref:SCP-like protein n=1 Tax=Streptomyces dengpaensis TaxID=2049881 RepID=A0ABM6SPE7_9ACTN|nr:MULTISPECIES: CAP domain-containing protein [Streptomyces]AVH56266.1 SCP-like protein [Streptomyces dengpaensis]PIB07231.1 SCP-like protein [Streptomyces sp. HG99]
MGRHRRSAAGRAARGRATEVTNTRELRTDSYGPENLYGYAAVADLPHSSAARSHRKRKAATPVRTGLLGVSAAVALGTAAVATGVLPGSDNYSLGGGSGGSDDVQSAGTPSGLETQQGGASGTSDSREDTSTSHDAERSASAPPSTSPAAPTTAPPKKPATEPSKTTKPEQPSKKPTKAPKTTPPVQLSPETAAEAEVLKLVNEERAKVGCSPVAANSALSDLAQAFSEDMDLRGFFDHSDPSGLSPWDRAAKAGIANLGGENIARGQATAAAVMEAWMNSPGHRANILNCDFKTLGVGTHFGSGGPWWTQNFGY